jgi:hypothetical protein
MAMVGESGGTPVGAVQHEEAMLDEDQAERVEDWVKDLVVERKRAQQPRPAATRRQTGAASEFGAEAAL